MADLNDPTAATSRALNRRAFAQLSATATAFGGSFASAMAQSDRLGAPHPPLVAEDDSAIDARHRQIQGAGRSIDAYYAAPRNAGTKTPAIVIVHAIWGLDAQLRDVTRRYAKEGYIAIAPDLYTGLGAPSGDGTSDFAPFRAVAQKLSDDIVDADLAAAAGMLRERSTGRHKVGVTGFCMGGAIALRQTVNNAATFAAASVFYGAVRYGTTGSTNGTITPIALDYASQIGMPLMGSYGGRDTSIPPDDVRALDAKLTALGKEHDIHIYDEAGHAFFDDTRSSYVPSAAADAWIRTLGWFKAHLN
jgi:carboxymethylenebutenolidase